MKKYTMGIEGMHCASCSSNVEKSLRKITGIRNVSISLLMKKGTLDAEESVSAEQIKQAIEKTGYKVTSIK